MLAVFATVASVALLALVMIKSSPALRESRRRSHGSGGEAMGTAASRSKTLPRALGCLYSATELISTDACAVSDSAECRAYAFPDAFSGEG